MSLTHRTENTSNFIPSPAAEDTRKNQNQDDLLVHSDRLYRTRAK